MAGKRKKIIFAVSEVLSMLDLDDAQSGSDFDINDLYDESDSDISDLDDDSTYLLNNIWKAMNLYVSRDAKSKDVIPSQ